MIGSSSFGHSAGRGVDAVGHSEVGVSPVRPRISAAEFDRGGSWRYAIGGKMIEPTRTSFLGCGIPTSCTRVGTSQVERVGFRSVVIRMCGTGPVTCWITPREPCFGLARCNKGQAPCHTCGSAQHTASPTSYVLTFSTCCADKTRTPQLEHVVRSRNADSASSKRSRSVAHPTVA